MWGGREESGSQHRTTDRAQAPCQESCCATNAEGSFTCRRGFVMRCCTSDEGRPFRTTLRGEVLNQHMLRWLKTVVVSDV
jgi:hypothetical protein